MKLVKTLAASAVLAMSSFATQASTINVGGVNWDPSGDLDFSAETSESFKQSYNASTNTLTGFGKIVTVQGSTDYCKNAGVVTCELLFRFNATATSTTSYTTNASNFLKLDRTENYSQFLTWQFTFAPALVEIFVAAKNTFTGTYASVGGVSWLNTTLTNLDAVATFFKTDITFSNALFGTSSGKLTAVNDTALASKYFVASNFEGSVDSTFGSRSGGSRSPAAGKPNTFTDKSNLNILADTVAVPEPSSLAVLGLGLIGLAGAARRKTSK